MLQRGKLMIITHCLPAPPVHFTQMRHWKCGLQPLLPAVRVVSLLRLRNGAAIRLLLPRPRHQAIIHPAVADFSAVQTRQVPFAYPSRRASSETADAVGRIPSILPVSFALDCISASRKDP